MLRFLDSPGLFVPPNESGCMLDLAACRDGDTNRSIDSSLWQTQLGDASLVSLVMADLCGGSVGVIALAKSSLGMNQGARWPWLACGDGDTGRSIHRFGKPS